jgi:hypothetical protein
MILLLQSALRALMLGAFVWSLLRLFRLRDARTETAVWTLVLAASLAMPLLTPWLEAKTPGLHLPVLGLPAHALPLRALPALPPSAAIAAGAESWISTHAAALLWGLYLAVASAMLARLGLGLALAFRLWRRAMPLAPTLRVSPCLRSPMVFGRAILLPPQWREWPEARRSAVLAHEECHVARGDFFLQLAAGIHRALFWFSPFSWWLLRELCTLAESASDAAAVQRTGDRASYAELLVEVARGAQELPALVAMAKGPDIAWRVERILNGDAAERSLGGGARAFAAAAALAVSLGFAGAHTAGLAAGVTSGPITGLATKLTVATKTPARPGTQAAPIHAAARTAPAHRRVAGGPHKSLPAPQAQAAPAVSEDPEVTYNPRALLDGPKAVAMPILLVVGHAR